MNTSIRARPRPRLVTATPAPPTAEFDLRLLGECTREARQQPTQAAARFFKAFCERPEGSELVLRILDIPVSWAWEDVLEFERMGYAYLITGRWGQVWLAPDRAADSELQNPAAPRLSPRGLWLLAEALVKRLAA